MPIAGEHHPAFEEYCECIFELDEDDVDVIQARIAERLQVSRPAVSEMIRRLEAEGLVTTEGTTIQLTAAGAKLAQQVVRRHRLAERFLTDILGLSWAVAHHEAGKWEHVMSDEVEEAMDRVLGSPTTCPHGNPIPGSQYLEPTHRAARRGRRRRRSSPSAASPKSSSSRPGLLDFLEESSIQPGKQRLDHRGLARRHDDRARSKAATSASARSPATASWSACEPRSRRAAHIGLLGWRCSASTIARRVDARRLRRHPIRRVDPERTDRRGDDDAAERDRRASCSPTGRRPPARCRRRSRERRRQARRRRRPTPCGPRRSRRSPARGRSCSTGSRRTSPSSPTPPGSTAPPTPTRPTRTCRP